MDLPGPEIRTGSMEKKTTTFTLGTEITIYDNNKYKLIILFLKTFIPFFLKKKKQTNFLFSSFFRTKGNENGFGIDLPNLGQLVKVGSVILVADGALQLTVSSIKSDNAITCTVNNTATITENKTVHLVGLDPSQIKGRDSLNEVDKQHILFGISKGFLFFFF